MGMDIQSGSDLCVGTTDGNTLTTSANGEWREITLGAGYVLEANKKYGIVLRGSGADSDNTVEWKARKSTATYAGGCIEDAPNYGVTWTSYPNDDYMFEEWGDPITEKTASQLGSGTDNKTSGSPIATLAKTEVGVGAEATIKGMIVSDAGYCGEVLEG